MGGESIKSENAVRDEVLTVLDELGLTKSNNGSRALIKLSLTIISVLLSALIIVVWFGISNITDNQAEEIKTTKESVKELKEVVTEQKYALKNVVDHQGRMIETLQDFDKRLTRIEGTR